MKKDSIKFVSYDGKYPLLCYGKLVLNINGKDVSFGINGDHARFFRSGGTCSMTRGFKKAIEKGPWVYHESEDTPDEIRRNKDMVMALLNEKMDYGCCGGCL